MNADRRTGPVPKPSRISHACTRCQTQKAKCSGGPRCHNCRQEGAHCVFGERRRARLDRNLAENRQEIADLELQNRILVQALRQVIGTMPDLLPENHAGLADIMTEYDLFGGDSPVFNIDDPAAATTTTATERNHHDDSPPLPQMSEEVVVSFTDGHGSIRQVGSEPRRSPSPAREKSFSSQKGFVVSSNDDGKGDRVTTTQDINSSSDTRTNAMDSRGGGGGGGEHTPTDMDVDVQVLPVTSIYYILD